MQLQHTLKPRLHSPIRKFTCDPAGCHDKQTFIATAIAQSLYPEQQFRKPGTSAEDYTELARRSYAKEYLKPLREAACVPEVQHPLLYRIARARAVI